ncbi:MAG TPA: peptidase M24 family protein [Actinobacteria bacterium]|nr:peptidase M24 family protein [Actinomycetota bacterium]
MFPDADYAGRLDRARAFMAERGADVMLLSVGADLPYFIGYEAMPLERLTMLVVPAEGDAALVVPRLEAPRVAPRGDAFTVLPWDETDDPVALVGRHSAAAVALIGEQTWARFLLELQREMPRTRFESAAPITRELRMRKDPDEIALLRAAGEATDRVVATLDGIAFAGRTERDLAAEVQRLTIAEGHDVASFAIVASGPNAASPHHEPTHRVIEEGDTVVIDFGGRWRGYCSDTTRTFVVGEPSAEVGAAHAVLATAQAAARAAVHPGVTCEDVDRAARDVIEDAGYGEYFIHRTGHGIGLEVHEHPYIVSGNTESLEQGMTFSIEPGIYLPGRFGMRIEDIVACAEDGVDELNRSPRALHSVV